MRTVRALAFVVSVWLPMVGIAGAATPLDASTCASCHGDVASQATATGSHSPLVDCASCHADRRPGRVGPHHRAVAQCRDCHDEPSGHPPGAPDRGGRRTTRNCLACHDPHGSPNLSLVRQQILWRRKVTSITFTSEAGVAPGSFVDQTNPRQGLCQTCHRKTEVYRRDGTGEPHFTQTCTLCHVHEDHFEPVADDANCGLCHVEEAQRFAKPSGHSTAFAACSGCHAEVSPTPGPGHRAIEPCADCHEGTMTHAPGGNGLPCTQCHEPHGTDNRQLVLDLLTTTQGTTVPIRFDNLEGRADGGFASASAPGTGVCEVCHTTTEFYRADGTGAPHFTVSCLPCHRHERGFAPQ